jgi:GNAT superfamily N-acetyltransferase
VARPSIREDFRVGDDGCLQVRQCAHPGEISAGLSRQLTDCWVMVSNAGGAVGFLPPADSTQVSPVVARLVAGLDPQCSRLLLALDGEILAGWLNIRRELSPLVAHWGTISHLQTHPGFRGRGIGRTLMTWARQVAREEMGLEQLHLALRGGTGLERFYSRLGWEVVGSWPRALRVAPGDDRDEILMILAPL